MERFVVEADRRVVGIAVRVAGGFRFVCSDPAFRAIDGKVFRRARGLAGDVARITMALGVAGAIGGRS